MQEGDVRLGVERQGAVSRAVAVLHPPVAPPRSFGEAVPLWSIDHREVLELWVGGEHSAGYVQEVRDTQYPLPRKSSVL